MNGVHDKSLLGRIFVNAGWIGALLPLNLVLGIARMGLLAHMLGPHGFGTLAVLTATVGICEGVGRLRSAETLMSFGSKRLSEKDKSGTSQLIKYCYLADFFSSFIAYGLVLVAGRFLPKTIGIPVDMTGSLSILGLVIIFRSTSLVSRSILRIGDRFRWEFYVQSTSALLLTVGIAILYMEGLGRIEYVVVLIAANAALDGISAYLLARVVMSRMGFKSSRDFGSMKGGVDREVVRFQILSSMRNAVKSVSQNFDVLLVGSLSTSIEVGIYRASKQLCDFLRSAAATFVTSLYPEYSRLFFSGEVIVLQRLVKQLSVWFGAFSIAACVILALSVDWIIGLILGPEFMPAKLCIRILLISTGLFFAMTPMQSLPASAGKAGPGIKALILGLLIQALLMWLLVPHLGAVGAAWSTVGYATAWAMVMLLSSIAVLQGYTPESAKKIANKVTA